MNISTPSPGRGAVLAIRWGSRGALADLIGEAAGAAERLVIVDPVRGTPARDEAAALRVEAVPGATNGEAELIGHSLPDLYSLAPASRALKDLFPGLSETGRRTVTVLSPADLASEVGTLPDPLHIAGDTPGGERETLETLEASGLLDRAVRLDMRCGTEAFFEGGADEAALRAWLEARHFRLVARDDSEDPDWPVLHLDADPKGRRLAETEALVAARDKTIEELTAKSEERRKAVESRDARLKEATDKLAARDKAVEELTAKSEERRKAVESRDARLKEATDKLAARDKAVEELTAKSEERRKAVESRDARLKEATDKLAARDKAVEELTDKSEERRKAVESRDARLKEATDNLAARDKAVEELTAKSEERRKAVESRDARLKEATDKLAARDKAVEELTAKSEERRKALESRDARLKEATDKLAARDKAVEELTAKSEEHRKGVETRDARLKEATDTLAARDKALKQAEDARAEAVRSATDKQKRIDAGQAEIRRLKEALALSEDGVARARAENDGTRQDLSNALEGVSRMHRELEDLRNRYTAVFDEKSRLEQLILQLTPRLQEAASHLKGLALAPPETPAPVRKQVRKSASKPKKAGR